VKRTILAVLALALFAVLTSSGWIVTHNSSKQLSLANCYYGSLQKDQVLLKIDSQVKGEIKGYLTYAFYQKDNSKGEFTGTFANNKLEMDYAFWSEGVLSHRPVIYTRSGDLLSGDGFVLHPTTKCEVISGL
jgi:hypothetical protein